MSEAIKCKAWDKTNKEWVDYGFCLRFDANGNYEILNAFAEPFADRELVPVLFTGSHDQHNQDIYDGAVLSWRGLQYTVYYDHVEQLWQAHANHDTRPVRTGLALRDIDSYSEVVGHNYEVRTTFHNEEEVEL